MSADPASRALRALAADLAALGDDDLDAILGELDAPSRERLLDLIAAFRRGDAPAPAAPAPVDAPELSPWLAGRLRGEVPDLTASALQALRAAAAAAGWAERPAARPAPARRSVLSRLGLGR
jgi:hypothetical protein